MSPRIFVALLALAACSDPAKANGTALFVVSDWDAGVEVTQLFFTGRLTGGSDVFKPSYRPETAAGPLTPPQSVRVLLPDGFGGSPVTVEVLGYNADGTPAGYGSAGATITDGQEVTVNVDLAPTPPPPPAFDGGTSPDGGTIVTGGDCSQCTQSCCVHIFNTTKCLSQLAPALGTYACGATGKTCRGCDLLTTDSCDPQAGCRCGMGPSCPQGLFCNGGKCQCGPPSCSGCCTTEGACLAGSAVDHCGSGGLRCEPCGLAPATCDNGVCSDNVCRASMVTPSGKCESGVTFCIDAGTFPFCRSGSSGSTSTPCKACDYYTSNACTPNGCACGDTKCLSGQLCAAGECVVAPQELMHQ